jgi:Txe/YoeB family toxin of Txe-Axe toxin-antitoxin module
VEEERISDNLKENRIKIVGFVDNSLYKAFQQLKSGKFEEKELASFIQRAINDLKDNPFIGVPIQRRLWPIRYVRKFSINNLRKYNLPNGWRLIYTLKGNEVEIVSIILEWFSHKDYEKRFKY